jgi:hypothetical protein
MDLYQEDHDTLRAKLDDMGVEIVLLTVIYALTCAACVAWFVSMFLSTDWADGGLHGLTMIDVGFAGVLFGVITAGIWWRLRWTSRFAMGVHGLTSVWGLLGLRAGSDGIVGSMSAGDVSVGFKSVVVILSLGFFCWWKRVELRAWTRAS